MTYSLISQEIISGNGISVPMIYSLKYNYDFSSGMVPYLAQPPLLPLLFAMLGGVTPQNFFAAKILNVMSHVTISIFTFLLIKTHRRMIFDRQTGVEVNDPKFGYLKFPEEVKK